MKSIKEGDKFIIPQGFNKIGNVKVVTDTHILIRNNDVGLHYAFNILNGRMLYIDNREIIGTVRDVYIQKTVLQDLINDPKYISNNEDCYEIY